MEANQVILDTFATPISTSMKDSLLRNVGLINEISVMLQNCLTVDTMKEISDFVKQVIFVFFCFCFVLHYSDAIVYIFFLFPKSD